MLFGVQLQPIQQQSGGLVIERISGESLQAEIVDSPAHLPPGAQKE
jgi:hypothetical protein